MIEKQSCSISLGATAISLRIHRSTYKVPWREMPNAGKGNPFRLCLYSRKLELVSSLFEWFQCFSLYGNYCNIAIENSLCALPHIPAVNI